MYLFLNGFIHKPSVHHSSHGGVIQYRSKQLKENCRWKSDSATTAFVQWEGPVERRHGKSRACDFGRFCTPSAEMAKPREDCTSSWVDSLANTLHLSSVLYLLGHVGAYERLCVQHACLHGCTFLYSLLRSNSPLLGSRVIQSPIGDSVPF